jgi:16S rRNA (uracil1498-N3)-methyltransferase
LTRRRWIADEVSGSRAALTGEHADHLVRVLRARVGQEFDIASGDRVWRGRVTSLGDGRVEFELSEEIPVQAQISITLALAIFKFDRMEWAIEKCTELGVSRIVPIVAARTDPHLAQVSRKRVERWRRIGLQASEQSRRSASPEIADPIDSSTAAALEGGVRIVLSESEQATLLRNCLQTLPHGPTVALAIGPEGGWTENELRLFEQKGWISASLGRTVLRTETAAIAATALVVSEMD